MSLAYRSKVVTAHGGHKAAMCLLCIHTCVSNETLPPHSPSLPLPSPPSIQLQPTHLFSIFQLQQEGHHLGWLFRCPFDQGGTGEPVMVALHCGCVLRSGPPQLNGRTIISHVLHHVLTGSFKEGRLLNSGWLSILLCGRHMEWKAVNVSVAVGLSH